MRIMLFSFEIGLTECCLGIVIIAVLWFVILQLPAVIEEIREKRRAKLRNSPMPEEIIQKRAEFDEMRLRRKAFRENEQRQTKLREEAVRAKNQREAAERRELDARLESERMERRAEEQNRFRASDDFKLIRQFVTKYGLDGNDDELSKLRLLLERRGWFFSIDELRNLIFDEHWQKLDDLLEERIFAQNPATVNVAIRNLLGQFETSDRNLVLCFAYLLKRHGFRDFVAPDGDGVLAELLIQRMGELEEEIELENFEERLSRSGGRVSLEDVDQLNGKEFEDFLKKLFTKMGYAVEQTRLSGDQGADLVVVRFGDKSVIQAKRSGGKVGNSAIQEIMAAISFYRAQKGMVVTNNYFTSAAIELASANNIELVDRGMLGGLINKHW